MSAEQRYTKEEMDKRDMFACTVLAALVGTPELRGIHQEMQNMLITTQTL